MVYSYLSIFLSVDVAMILPSFSPFPGMDTHKLRFTLRVSKDIIYAPCCLLETKNVKYTPMKLERKNRKRSWAPRAPGAPRMGLTTEIRIQG